MHQRASRQKCLNKENAGKELTFGEGMFFFFALDDGQTLFELLVSRF